MDCEKIKRLRLRAGLSQEEAAIKAGMVGAKARPGSGKSNWAKLESSKAAPNITLKKLEAVAVVLNTTAKDLLK